MKSLVVAFSLIALWQGVTRLQSPNGEIEIHHKRITIGAGGGSLTVEGAPALLNWKDAGVKASAALITAEAGTDVAARAYFLKSANLTGAARLEFDNVARHAFLADLAATRGVPAPPTPESNLQAVITSETMTYTGDFDLGTATIPGALHAASRAHGEERVALKTGQALRVYDDSAEFRATSGTFEVATHPKEGALPFRKGSIMGPTTFSYRRQSTLDGAPEPPNQIDGTADRIDFDFTGENRTVTLTGNVRVEGRITVLSGGKHTPYEATTSGARAVITFGPKMEFRQIVMEGDPTDSTIKRPSTQGASGGGGR